VSFSFQSPGSRRTLATVKPAPERKGCRTRAGWIASKVRRTGSGRTRYSWPAGVRKTEVAHHGQRPRAASSRERARTSRPATSFPSALRLSISPYHPGGT
jgi:hypothetical protein